MAQQLAPPTDHERGFFMSYDEYLAWSSEDTVLSEWVDGKVTVFVSATWYHQQLALFLARLMLHLAETNGLGEVIVAPFEMLIRGGRSSREPDVMFVARQHRHRLSKRRLTGPGDLVVEVISDDSVTRDRRDKRREYEAEGVPEYWLFDARDDRRGLVAYRLGADGRYVRIAPEADGAVRSAVLPGFFFHPDWFAPESPPPLASVLRGAL